MMPRPPRARAARLRRAAAAGAGAVLLLLGAAWARPPPPARAAGDLFAAAGRPEAPHPITLAVVHGSTRALVAHAAAALDAAGNEHYVLLALDEADVATAAAVRPGRTVAAAAAAAAAGRPPPRWCAARRNAAAPPCMAASVALAAAAVVARGHAVLVLSPLAGAVAPLRPLSLALPDAALHVLADRDGDGPARARLPLRAEAPVVTGALWAPARADLAPALAHWALELAGGRSPTAAALAASCARDRACAATGAPVRALPAAAFARGDVFFSPGFTDADRDAVLLLALDGLVPAQAEYRLRHARAWAGPPPPRCANHTALPPHALAPGDAAGAVRAVAAFFEASREAAVECCVVPGFTVGGGAGATPTLLPFDAVAAWPAPGGGCRHILPFAGRDAGALGDAVAFGGARAAATARTAVPRALIAPALARHLEGDAADVPDDALVEAAARWLAPGGGGGAARGAGPAARGAPGRGRPSSARLALKTGVRRRR